MNELIYNKNCFIRKDPFHVYCSKCGKRVMQDTYNMNKHAKDCGFRDYDFIEIFNEAKTYCYAFRIRNGIMKFFVFAPHLEERASYTPSYSGGAWKQVYSCTLLQRTNRIMDERGSEGLIYWSKRCVASLNNRPDYEILREFFNIPEAESLTTLFKMYLSKGFRKSLFINDKEAEEIVNKYNPLEKESWKLNKLLHKLADADIEVSANIEWTSIGKPVLVLKVTVGDNSFVMLVAERYFYCNEDIGLKMLMTRKVRLDMSYEDIECFDNFYPSFGLKSYLDSGCENIFVALFGCDYNLNLELLIKSGCYTIADNYYGKRINSMLNVKDGLNLEDSFGSPAKVLRKVEADCLDFGEFFAVLSEIYKVEPNYLNSVERLSHNYITFLRENVMASKKYERTYLRGFNQLSRDVTYRMARYISTLDVMNYRIYLDYLNLSMTVFGRYEFGVVPRNLREAHDEVLREYNKEQIREDEGMFYEAVNSKDYLSLITEGDEEFESEDYVIIAPKCGNDLLAEGRALHHCVGIYVRAVALNNTNIYFLRRKECPDVPYATIEVKRLQLIQLKAICNSKASSSAQLFVRKWCEKKGLEIKTFDMDSSK